MAVGRINRFFECIVIDNAVLLVARETGNWSFARKMIEQEDGVDPLGIDVADHPQSVDQNQSKQSKNWRQLGHLVLLELYLLLRLCFSRLDLGGLRLGELRHVEVLEQIHALRHVGKDTSTYCAQNLTDR